MIKIFITLNERNCIENISNSLGLNLEKDYKEYYKHCPLTSKNLERVLRNILLELLIKDSQNVKKIETDIVLNLINISSSSSQEFLEKASKIFIFSKNFSFNDFLKVLKEKSDSINIPIDPKSFRNVIERAPQENPFFVRRSYPYISNFRE